MESKYGKKLQYNVGEMYTCPTFDIESDLNKFIKKLYVYYVELKKTFKT